MQESVSSDEKRLFSLTRAWLGLFFFAVLINLAPFIPGFDSLTAEDKNQLVVSDVHTAYCTSHFWNRTGSPRSNALVSAALHLPAGSSSESQQSVCVTFQFVDQTPHRLAKFYRVIKERRRARFFHIIGHPERGPPFLI